MLSEQREHSSTIGFKAKVLTVLNTTFRYLILVTAACGIPQVFASKIHLSASENESTSGYFTLRWEPKSESTQYTLVQSLDQQFLGSARETIKWHIDSHHSFSISGLNSGIYYYRIAKFNQPDNWSNTVQISVKHHSLGNAYFIFTLGAVLFFLLVAVILLNFKNRSRGF